MRISQSGNVAIGVTMPGAKLHVEGGLGTAVFGSGFTGVYGTSNSGTGVAGNSDTGTGVYGHSFSNWAGYFDGNVHVTGTITQASDARLKQGVTDLGYGLREVLGFDL
jgi:hypothetical protein